MDNNYKPGDVANGHVLTEKNEWVPIGSTTIVDGKPKKKKRIFVWFFLAVQALFVIWLIAGIGQAGGPAEDCGTLSQETCNNAQDIGTGIGVVLVIMFWCLVDFVLGVGYAIYRLARRP